MIATLLEKQSLFANDILSQESPRGCYTSKTGKPEQLIKVYRSAVMGNLLNALKITYSKTAKILGDSSFHRIARQFCSECLPREGCLDAWGAGFSEYLKNPYPYLSDLASFEWSKSQSFLLSEPKVLGMNDLQHLIDKGWENWTAVLTPTLFLQASEFDLQGILSFADDGSSSLPNPLEKSTYVMGTIKSDVIQLYWLTAETFQFLDQAGQGKSMLEIFEDTPNLNLSETLCFAFSNGLFIDIQEA